MGPRTDKNTTKGERKMIIKIEIDEARSAKIVEWLAGKFDKIDKAPWNASTHDDIRKLDKLNAEYGGIREGLAAAGIRITYDRHTKRPIGIEAI
jgi:hypothetical protein